MTAEQEAAQLVEDLQRLSEYSASLLAADNIRPETLYTRKAYAYSQFIFSLSFVDGIITLARQGQARSMIPLVRGLWEGWLGVRFAYATRSHVWIYYLLLREELKNRKIRNRMLAAGSIKDPADTLKRNKEAAKIINHIKRRYKELPVIPGVITASNRSLEKRDIKIRQKCQILDHYQTVQSKSLTPTTSLTDWYDSVYMHLSGTAHVSVTELNNLYVYDGSGGLHVDISGGNDRNYLKSLLLIAYLYHYLLMKIFITNVSTSKHRIPDDIKAARRRLAVPKH